MVYSNMSEMKEQKLLIIEKSENPRRFEWIKLLETNYDFNKKAWMTSNIFEKQLLDTDNKTSQDNQKIILFVGIIVLLVHVHYIQSQNLLHSHIFHQI